jgi:hypothetical protein
MVVDVEPPGTPLPTYPGAGTAPDGQRGTTGGADRADQTLVAVVVHADEPELHRRPQRSPTWRRWLTVAQPLTGARAARRARLRCVRRGRVEPRSSLSGSSGISRGHATCGRNTNGFDGFTTAAAAAQQLLRMRHVPLVELVAPATSTAAARPVRPRPVCRIDAVGSAVYDRAGPPTSTPGPGHWSPRRQRSCPTGGRSRAPGAVLARTATGWLSELTGSAGGGLAATAPRPPARVNAMRAAVA